MFTGIVKDLGEVILFEKSKGRGQIRVHCPLTSKELQVGASVAVNGVCLTAVSADETCFEADLSHETLERTSLGRAREGTIVNLELPLRAGEFLGGHWVQGHVDSLAEIWEIEPAGDSWRMAIQYPEQLAAFIVEKGSITVDGVSLTINKLGKSRIFEVMLIPHTWSVTRAHQYQKGEMVNIEVDVMARYLARFIETQRRQASEVSA